MSELNSMELLLPPLCAGIGLGWAIKSLTKKDYIGFAAGILVATMFVLLAINAWE